MSNVLVSLIDIEGRKHYFSRDKVVDVALEKDAQVSYVSLINGGFACTLPISEILETVYGIDPDKPFEPIAF